MKKVIITSFVALLLVLLTGCSFNTTSTDVSVVNTTTSPVITTTTQAPTTSIKTTTIDDIFRYYGWEIEGNNYTGWLISDDGNKLEVTSERRNQRIYANLIEEPRSFKITVDIDAEVESAPYIRILEHTVELDSRHGNGNQVYVKGIDNEDWLEATGCKCTVVIERYNSGDINVTVKGSNNAVKTGTYKSSSKSSYVEYGIYAGTATYENLTVETQYLPVSEYGYLSDTTDFTGWTQISKTGVRCDYANAVNNRVWKPLIENQNDFAISLDIKVDVESSAYVKVLGVQVEFDSRHGNGNQVYIKGFGSDDWFNATEGNISLLIESESESSIRFEIKGKDNTTIMSKTLNKKEASDNLELGSYAGTVSFDNIYSSTIVDRIIKNYKDSNELYLQLAKQAVSDNIYHWWYGDTETGYIHPTHSGKKLDPNESAPIWEGAMVLYGIYDMWYLTKSNEYKDYLVAEANYYKENYKVNPGNLENPAGRPGPASDDCAWASMLYLIFYEVTGDSWFLTRSANLCYKTQERWYDEELGGMRYSDTNNAMSLYECGLTISWLRLYELTQQQKYYDYALASYTRLHNKLYYDDGIYYCEVDVDGPRGGTFHITEGGSSSFLAGNMAMASIAAKLYKITNDKTYLNRVYTTNAGILKWYNKDGVLLNDRDAWTEGTYAAYYASNVLTLEGTDEIREVFMNTALSIMQNARTSDGRYGGSWQGPAEGDASRWYKGGSVPTQIMTSGSTVSIVTAAALLEAGINDFTR